MRLPYLNPSRRYKFIVRDASIDALITLVSFTAAFLARAVTTSLDFVNAIIPILLIAGLNVLFLYLFKAYFRIWKRTSGHEITLLIKAIGVSTLIVTAISFVLTTRPIPLSIVLIGQTLTLGGVVVVRFRSRLVSGFAWRWKFLWKDELPQAKTRVLIIGAGESGQTLAWRMKHRFPEKSYQVVGFIDDDPEKQGMYVEGCRVMGTSADIVRVAEANSIDLIVIAVHKVSGVHFRKILNECELTKARIKIIPDVYALMNATSGAALLRDIQVEDLIGRKPVARHEGIDLSPVTQKTVLITGAAGSIGSELSRQMLDYEPKRMLLLDNNESGLHDLLTDLKTRRPQADIAALLADITGRESLTQVFSRETPQVVFHAAAYKHVPMLEHFPSESVRVNVIGTRNVAELARDYRAERFVLISTDKAVNPSSIMGASKRLCELMLHVLSKENCPTIFTGVRFGNVLNSRGSVVPTFEHQIDNGGPVTVTHPDMTRYFMSIPEAVNLIIHAACMTQGDDIFVLRMGEVVRIVELAERMIRLRGLRPNIDIKIEFTGVRLGEKLHEELFTDQEVPKETDHPAIVEVSTWNESFDSRRFWHDLDQLDLKHDGLTLEDFHQIINQPPVAIQVQRLAS
jgi:FlaA1/EpsC-like NDP-sugar epimerase